MKKYSLLLLCLCSCAMAQQPDILPPVIDNSSYPEAAPIPSTTTNAPSSNTVYELVIRLDKMQAEVQQLTGKVEEQGNQINELKKQQSTLYSDFDERLQNIEKAGSPRAATPVAETPTAPPPVDTTEAAPTQPTTASPEAERSTTTITIPTQTAKPARTAPPAPQPEIKASGGEKQAYQQAYSALRSGKTDQSIEQFKSYLSQYPTGGYADLANYWLGEAYRVKPDMASAQQAFNTVLDKYPSSTKVADALLKLGYIEADQKNSQKAREYLTRVTNEFPNTPAARSAEKKLTQLK